MKFKLDVFLSITVDSDEVQSMEQMMDRCKEIKSISQIYSIPSVDRDSIKVTSIAIEVK